MSSPGTRPARSPRGGGPPSASAGLAASSGSAARCSVAAARARSMTSSSRSTESSLRRSTGRRSARCRARCPRGAARGRSGRARSRRGSTATAVEPLHRGAGRVGGADEQAQPGVAAAADAAAQLVQLGDAEPVGVEDHHHGRVGDVDADLDDGGGDEHVDVAGGEGLHHPVLVLGRHPAVQHLDAQAGQRRPRPARGASSSTACRGALVTVLVALARVDPRARRRRPAAPGPTSSRTRCQARSSQAGCARAGTTVVCTSPRPAGSSVSVEVSRSPKTVIATVRGIGVAVITSTCGGSAGLAAERGALLDAEAVLLVDDDQAEVGELHVLLEQGVGADHDAGLAAGRLRERGAAGGGVQRPGQQGDPGRVLGTARGSRPRPGRRACPTIERWCCWASTSVGASSAACPPESTTWSIARRATTVLPEPTSPWSSRCIGWPWPSSVGDLLADRALAVGEREREPLVEPVEHARRAVPGAGWRRWPRSRRGAGRARSGRRTPRRTSAASRRLDLLRPVVGAVDPAQRLVGRRRAPRPRARTAGSTSGTSSTRSRASRDGVLEVPRVDAGHGRVDRDQVGHLGDASSAWSPYIRDSGLVSCHCAVEPLQPAD